jgi:hypothetical protein
LKLNTTHQLLICASCLHHSLPQQQNDALKDTLKMPFWTLGNL